MAKSRSAMTGEAPAGRVTLLMWIVSLISVPAEVDRDLLGDVAGRHVELEVVAHLGQDAAALEARGLLAVDVLDRDVDRDPGAVGQAQEVDVGRQVLDDVALDAAADDLVVLAVDLDVDERRQEAAGLELLQEDVELDVDRLRVLCRRRRSRRVRSLRDVRCGRPPCRPLRAPRLREPESRPWDSLLLFHAPASLQGCGAGARPLSDRAAEEKRIPGTGR